MAKVDFNSLKDNSRTNKKPRKMEKVVTGEVTEQKETLGAKFAGVFLNGNLATIVKDLSEDVIKPSLQDLASSAISKGVNMMIYGDKEDHTRSSNNGSVYYSYDKPSYAARSKSSTRRSYDEPKRAKHDFRNVSFKNERDAYKVLDTLVEAIDQFENPVTVNDFYDLAGITGNFTDEKYGWTNLKEAKVKSISTNEGRQWVIVFPDVEAL